MAAGIDGQDLTPVGVGAFQGVSPLGSDPAIAAAGDAAPDLRREAGTAPAGTRRPVPRLQGIDTP